MGKRKKKEDDKMEGLPMWMASYSDMVTLLLTFFVLLQAMSNFDDSEKVEAVFESLYSAFGVTGKSQQESPADLLGALKLQPANEQISSVPIQARLREAFSKHMADDFVRMTHNEEEIRIRLDDRILFKSGATEVHPQAYAALAEIAQIVNDESVELTVEGHTDAEGDEETNWNLSISRAHSVVRLMRAKGVAGEHLEVSAFGSFKPASTFTQNNAWNRRIELVIHGGDYSAAGAVQPLMDRGDGNGR